MNAPEPLTLEDRIARLERTHRRHWLSGPLVWLIAALIGGGVLWIAIDRAQSESADSINHSVCGFRKLAAPTLASSKQAATDPTLSDSAKKRAAARIVSTEAFLLTQITVPRSFDCASLKP